MQSYYVWTVGCQMNKADSERLESALDQMGLVPGDSLREADAATRGTRYNWNWLTGWQLSSD